MTELTSVFATQIHQLRRKRLAATRRNLRLRRRIAELEQERDLYRQLAVATAIDLYYARHPDEARDGVD